MNLKGSAFTFFGIVLLACGGSSAPTGNASAADSIPTCDPGLDVSGSGDFAACSLASNPCAYPQELCQLATSAPVGAGQCVCDPRRVNDPSPGSPNCAASGNSCVSSARKCSNNGGTVTADVGCSGEQVCCAGIITSPNDPGCAGANLQQGSCVDADDNYLPAICCSTSASNSCQSPSDCTGFLPRNVETCADGTSAGAQWDCNAGTCVISYCDNDGGPATIPAPSGSDDGGAPSDDGSASADGS